MCNSKIIKALLGSVYKVKKIQRIAVVYSKMIEIGPDAREYSNLLTK